MSRWLNGDSSSLDLSPLPGDSRLTRSLPDLTDLYDLRDLNAGWTFPASPGSTSSSSEATPLTYPSSVTIPFLSSTSSADTLHGNRCSDLRDIALKEAESNPELDAVVVELSQTLDGYSEKGKTIVDGLGKMEENSKTLQEENKKLCQDFESCKKILHDIEQYLQKLEGKFGKRELDSSSSESLSKKEQEIDMLKEGLLTLKVNIESIEEDTEKLEREEGKLTEVVSTMEEKVEKLEDGSAQVKILLDKLIGDSDEPQPRQEHLPSQTVEEISPRAPDVSVRPKTRRGQKSEYQSTNVKDDNLLADYVNMIDVEQIHHPVSDQSVRPKLWSKAKKVKFYSVTTTADVHCQDDGTRSEVRPTGEPVPTLLPRKKRKPITDELICVEPPIEYDVAKLQAELTNLSLTCKVAEDEWEDIQSEGVFGAVGGSPSVSRTLQLPQFLERKKLVSKGRLQKHYGTTESPLSPVKAKLHDYVNIGLDLLRNIQADMVRGSLPARSQERGQSDTQITNCDNLDSLLQEKEDAYLDMTPNLFIKFGSGSHKGTEPKLSKDYVTPIDALKEPRGKQRMEFRQKLKSRFGARKLQVKAKAARQKRKELSDMVNKQRAKTQRLKKLTAFKMIETAALEKLAIESKRQIMRLMGRVRQTEVGTKQLEVKLKKSRSQERKLANEHAYEQGRRPQRQVVRYRRPQTGRTNVRTESPGPGQRPSPPMMRYTQSPTKRHVHGLSPKMSRLCDKRDDFQNVPSRLSQAAGDQSTVRRRVLFNIPDQQPNPDGFR